MLKKGNGNNKYERRWPEGAIVYQVYPRSFYDANGDGIGDLRGLIEKLDYLKDLGVNAIWLSPFYPSPMADFGYDVADYCDVDPIFGNLADFDELLQEAHARSMKLMVDLVPNHTSDEHVWFRQSKQSREDAYSDWYIWHDPKGHNADGKPIPPNNWVNKFDALSAWEWDTARQQFYLHAFHAKQPDLNWSNPKVREAVKDAMRFWLDRGVDGFRVDAVNDMAKDPLFKDDPPNPDYNPETDSPYWAIKHVNSEGWPPLYAYLAEMADVLKEPKYAHSGRFMVTESYPEGHNPVEEYLEFYEGMDPEVAAPFNFEGISLPWQAEPWREFLHTFHTALDTFDPLCVASYAFGNHDRHRLVTRLGEPAARSAAVLLLTLPGMAFIYNGDELGMKDGIVPPEMIQDPAAKGDDGKFKHVHQECRDPERTPLHWTPGPNAGFTSAHTPWLPIADNFETRNAESELQDPDSFLNLYRALGKLRNGSDALRLGSFELIETGHASVLGFFRERGDERITTLINFSNKPVEIKPATEFSQGDLIISTNWDAKRRNLAHKIQLFPHEAVVFVRY